MSSVRTVVVAVLATAAAASSDPSVNVPLGHRAYAFLERCEARGMTDFLGDGIKPFSRLEVARLLAAADSADGVERRLTRVDRQQLAGLRREFPTPAACSAATAPSGARTGSWRGPEPLLTLEGERAVLAGELLVRQQADLFSGLGRQDAERIYRSRAGVTVRGELAGRLGVYTSFQQSMESGTRTYRRRDDVYESRIEVPQLKGSRTDFHEGKAYVVFSLPFGDVEVGKDDVAWGPGPADNLGLSANAPSFDMVRLRARYGRLRVASIAGWLRPCPDRPDAPLCRGLADPSSSYVVNGMSRPLDREKYLAAHRLEAALAPWLDVGFQEVVVYGDRGPEITYLNPLMFYWAAQSYLGDHDNLMMGVDFDLHPGNGVRAYLAYVVDDLKKLKVLSNDFANKFSLQVGLLWVDPPGCHDTDLRAEYVRIEPWIYTHKYPINTFSHFDAPLGHALGPNSDAWELSVTHRPRADLELAARLARRRHGDNVLLGDGTVINVGGDLHYGWRPGDEREEKSFLAGNVSRRTRAGVSTAWRPWPRLALAVGLEYEWGDNVPLPPRWEDGVALSQRTGYGDGRQRHLWADLRYGVF